MNRSLTLVVSVALGLSALALACSADEPKGADTNATDPAKEDPIEGEPGADKDGGADPSTPNTPAKDGGAKKDGGGGKDSGGGNPQPTTPTKADIQALLNSHCTPCHVGGSSAGLSLANDFTTATVNVASSELPSMKRITPGDKDASYLFHKLEGTHLDVGGAGVRMPKGGPYLSKSDIDDVGAFIDSL